MFYSICYLPPSFTYILHSCFIEIPLSCMLIKAAQPLPMQGANYCLPVVLVLTFSVYPVIVCVLVEGMVPG